MLTELGRQLAFHARAFGWTPRAVRRYWREVLRLLAEVGLGSGGLAAIGGTVVVVAFMTSAVGVEIGLQGYTALSRIGADALAGFLSSYANTREAAPLIAGIALTATVGAGFTAQLGAMRVAEEVDALEVMAVPSVPYLVTTRIVAGLLAVVPLFCVALIASYTATKLVIVLVQGQSVGTYEHYFGTFLHPADLGWAFAKALLMSLVVVSVHCYHGFFARGGPAGVGLAVGRAVRTSLVAVLLVDLAVDLSVFSGPSTVHISG
ncbi:ABC transporter permease [Kutzneria viridogrisea]|uniref:Phospholipid/cholesterol/gamma-HCH transport system permease protein n=1 Tax=Kutzneria viridogrisea TaxID=47990 RepID=A0ABR6BHG9_9PSEU|nr:phospholipid/cholesterol/gamma-HCH transport system permease protein [Kutzneria viridogrisea]